MNFTNFFFNQIPFFCNFKNDQKSIFEMEKSLKLPTMQFHEKKIHNFHEKYKKKIFHENDLFDFTSFLA